MPASEAQIAANRKNAERSTGPRSTQGKENSRRNALKARERGQARERGHRRGKGVRGEGKGSGAVLQEAQGSGLVFGFAIGSRSQKPNLQAMMCGTP